MSIVSGLARELAEAILDAAERAEEEFVSIGVIRVDDYFISTSAFSSEDECVVIIVPGDVEESNMF